MRTHLSLVVMLFVIAGTLARAQDEIEPRLKAVPFTAVTIEGGLWASRQQTNRQNTVGHLLDLCELEGRVRNLWRAAGRLDGSAEGIRKRDADLYRCIEAASYVLASDPDPQLQQRLERIVTAIRSAQHDDGYIHSIYGIDRPHILEPRHVDLFSAGHLIDAAIAYYRATNNKDLLDVARQYVHFIDQRCGPLSPRPTAYDHPKIEASLVRLSRLTGNSHDLDFARSLIDHRHQDGRFAQRPVRELEEADGHVIASLFLLEGMLAVGIEAGDRELVEAVRRVWDDAVSRRMYVTGAMGHKSEHFTEPYELENFTSIGEGCQSNALARLSHRMFLVDPDGRYADVLERVIYNNLLANVGLDGRHFYYHNRLSARPNQAFGVPYSHPQPLRSSPQWPRECLRRQPWFQCPCCPPNISMAIATIGEYIYAYSKDCLYVNLFVPCHATVPLADTSVRITQRTRYPWDGRIRLTVELAEPEKFAVRLRIPDWCRNLKSTGGLYRVARAVRVDTPQHPDLELGPDILRDHASDAGVSVMVNGQTLDTEPLDQGYLTLDRIWTQGDQIELDLPMPVLRIECHPRVRANAHRVALQRGPLVYCVEGVDHGGSTDSLWLPSAHRLSIGYRDDLLGGVIVMTGKAKTDDDRTCPLMAVPYGVWGNREVGEMDVWLRTEPVRQVEDAPPSES